MIPFIACMIGNSAFFGVEARELEASFVGGYHKANPKGAGHHHCIVSLLVALYQDAAVDGAARATVRSVEWQKVHPYVKAKQSNLKWTSPSRPIPTPGDVCQQRQDVWGLPRWWRW